MTNIELKAKLHDYDAAMKICDNVGASLEGELWHHDTYFTTNRGRLKLRECRPGEDHLIYYERADSSAATSSHYFIEPANAGVSQLLGQALGVEATVTKTRALWLWKNVRIHLDRVEGLGDFMEFEAVLIDESDAEDGHQKVDYLQRKFLLSDDDLIAVSYLDLTLASTR